MQFKDRDDAGEQLAQRLTEFQNRLETVVLGIPRGGIVVSAAVAHKLNLAMDVVVIRKIGTPSNPDLIVGALTSGGSSSFDLPLMKSLGITMSDLTPAIEREKRDAMRCFDLYRGSRKPLTFEEEEVIIVDDGVTTGVTLYAAILSAKAQGAGRIIVAVPVAPSDVVKILKPEVDELVCLYESDEAFTVSRYYDAYPQVTDEDVIELMRQTRPL